MTEESFDSQDARCGISRSKHVPKRQAQDWFLSSEIGVWFLLLKSLQASLLCYLLTMPIQNRSGCSCCCKGCLELKWSQMLRRLLLQVLMNCFLRVHQFPRKEAWFKCPTTIGDKGAWRISAGIESYISNSFKVLIISGVFFKAALHCWHKYGGVCHGYDALFLHRCMVPKRHMRMEGLLDNTICNTSFLSMKMIT